ncbi:CPBP family intramembrane glutamic endopeptidase [Stenomitos frigidus]|nr:type II CAAX endopeptidase family protein [Stenomitos frigidus]
MLSKLINYPAPVRIAAFLSVLVLVWMPLALPIYWLISDSNLVGILTLVALYSEFILLVGLWGRWVYRQPNLLWRYGLEFSRRMGLELLAGLLLGSFSVAALFITQSLFGWVVWQSPSIAILQVALEGLLVALGIGFVEELFFRGWLLDELQRDYRLPVVFVVDAAIFALVHGLKPQFPALFLLAVTLILAKQACTDLDDVLSSDRNNLRSQTLNRPRGRLGVPMGLHAGLVWGYYIVNVGKLIQYAPQVPEWLTGFDHNPLAGVIGILFLSALAVGLWGYANRPPI